MKSISAEVYIPALDITLDVVIPCHVTAGQAVSLIAQMVNRKARVVLDKDALDLFDSESRVMLSRETAFSDIRVPDACSLILI